MRTVCGEVDPVPCSAASRLAIRLLWRTTSEQMLESRRLLNTFISGIALQNYEDLVDCGSRYKQTGLSVDSLASYNTVLADCLKLFEVITYIGK